MGAVFFLPGILGTEMKLAGEKIWPPSPVEVKFGYERIAKLMDPNAEAGDPIRSVWSVFKVYDAMYHDLKEICAGEHGAPNPRDFVFWGYDWRVDIQETADLLANALRDHDAQDDVHIVAHSMGCLVSRLVLEDSRFQQEDWFSKIKTFTAMAGPHEGAPVAIARAMGLEGSMGISRHDLREFAADPAFPALYQLFPPADHFVCVHRTKGEKIPIFTKSEAEKLGLSWANVKKASEVHRRLKNGRKPLSVEYQYLAGGGLDTVTRLETNYARTRSPRGEDAGDGTVPLWSSVAPGSPHFIAKAEHGKVFKSALLREKMFQMLGARAPSKPFSTGENKPIVELASDRFVYEDATQMQILMTFAAPATKVRGQLSLERVDPVEEGESGENEFKTHFPRQDVEYSGAAATALKLNMLLPSEPGLYALRFKGSHETSEDTSAQFAVLGEI